MEEARKEREKEEKDTGKIYNKNVNNLLSLNWSYFLNFLKKSF